MRDMLNRYGPLMTTVFCGITAFWMLAMVWLPYSIMIEQSFRLYLPLSELGGPRDVYTLDNYLSLFDTMSTEPLFGIPVPIPVYVFLLTVFLSCIITVLCFVMAYPVAYFLAIRASISVVPLVIVILTIPLFVSEMLRTFAWFVILAFNGPLNAVTELMGLPKVRWISGYNGILIGMIYSVVLFMFFPLYNSLTALDRNQIEAAENLGGKWWQVHLNVIIPHAKPGISSGATMVFMFSVGSILIPQLLGSPSSRWFTEIILRSMFESQDWNTAAAYAFLLLLVCLLFITLVMRLFRVNLSDIAK